MKLSGVGFALSDTRRVLCQSMTDLQLNRKASTHINSCVTDYSQNKTIAQLLKTIKTNIVHIFHK